MIPAVIIAGGRGSRLSPATLNLPKPLVDINGNPFIYYLVQQLFKAGVRKITILAGYLGNEFNEVCGELENDFQGLKIEIHVSSPSLNTGERLMKSLDQLDDRFIFLYGDNYAPFDVRAYLDGADKQKNLGAMVVYRNDDNYSNSNVVIDANNRVISYGKEVSENSKAEHVDVGYFILNKNQIKSLEIKPNSHFGNDILSQLISQNHIWAKTILCRYYTVGSMERLQSSRLFFQKQSFVLIDRDGVLNEKQPQGTYVENESQFHWREGSLSGLKLLKEHGFRVVVITNQAGVGRGVFDLDSLDKVHQTMCRDVRAAGGEIEYIYVCPHHWEDECNCRKPKPGMLIQAQKDLMIDLTQTYFIGDDDRDGQAADAAGCLFKLVTPDERLDQVVSKLFQF
jgi:D-glycero-D-manno-heptose 1,7-bisphosphate phosphatase